MKTLNLGCGDDRRPDTIGCDISPVARGADVLCDLNRVPFPFRSGTFERVICQDIIEHVENIPRTLEEIHRICRPGARVEIRTPHFTSRDSYGDPTHRHHLAAGSFDFCIEGRSMPNVPCPVKYRLIRRQLRFYRIYRLLGLAALANRFTNRYEAHWAYLCPAENMVFELEVIK